MVPEPEAPVHCQVPPPEVPDAHHPSDGHPGAHLTPAHPPGHSHPQQPGSTPHSAQTHTRAPVDDSPESSRWSRQWQGLVHLHVPCPHHTAKHGPTALNKGPRKPTVTRQEPHGFDTPDSP